MENRFGLKDLFQIILLLSILISIWIGMFQYDRQWSELQSTQEKLDELTKDAARINRQLERGIALTPGTREMAPDLLSFERARAASLMDDYAEGGRLRRVFATKLDTITPYISQDAYAAEVQRHIFEPLCTLDPETLEWHPHLAESWETSPDGLTLTFKMRSGLTFSDGEPLTARDVQFTWEFTMNEKIKAMRIRSYHKNFASVRAKGDSVVFKLNEPYYRAFETAARMFALPRHFYEKYNDDYETYNNSTGLMLGSGPYRMESPTDWTPDKPLFIVRNARYWGPVQPSFDRIDWAITLSDPARVQDFKNKDLDLYGARPEQFDLLKAETEVTEFAQPLAYDNPVGGYLYVGWNQERGGEPTIFADQRVREAMTYLTDRTRICSEIYRGYASPTNGPFSPAGKQFNHDLPVRPYDPAKARELLAAAGFKDADGDGVLEDKDGKPLSFKLVYYQTSEDSEKIAILIKDLYLRGGVVVELAPADWPTMMDLMDKSDYEAMMLGWTGNLEIDLYQIFHSSQRGANGDNATNYSNPQLDALIDQARAEMDEDARMKVWRKCHEVMWHDQPYTFLVNRQALVFINKRIRNVQITRAGLNAPGNLWCCPLEWFIPDELQRTTN